MHWTTKIVAPPIRTKSHSTPPDPKPNCCCRCRRTRKGSSEWTTHRGASFPIPLCGKVPSSGLIGRTGQALSQRTLFLLRETFVSTSLFLPAASPPLLLGPGVSLSRNPPPRVKTHTSPERLSTCIYNMADKGNSSSSGGGGGDKEAVRHGTNERGNQVETAFITGLLQSNKKNKPCHLRFSGPPTPTGPSPTRTVVRKIFLSKKLLKKFFRRRRRHPQQLLRDPRGSLLLQGGQFK